MSAALHARRVLLVHAHPDDETLVTGALIAELVQDGVEVGLVTATRGERGEVVAGHPLKHLEGTPELSATREQELARANDALGVRWHAYLGSGSAKAGSIEHRYVDSGMRWVRPGLAGPAEDVGTDALTSASVDAVAADLIAAINSFQPDVVITYDEAGGYGHPDHVRCFEATALACTATETPLYVVVSDGANVVATDIVVDASAHLAVVQRALDAHRTQLTVEGTDVVHSGGQREPIVTETVLRRYPMQVSAGEQPSRP